MRRSVFTGLALLCSTGAALGAEAEPVPVEYFNPWQFIAAILVFVVAVLILSKTAWPKILGGLEARERKIRDEIMNAEDARKRADEALKEYERSLAEARSEAAAMIEKTKAEQARMAADLKAQAEAELTAMRESARQNIEAAKRAAIAEIYSEAATLATQIAEKILQREVSTADQQRLVEEALSAVTGESDTHSAQQPASVG